MTSENFTGNGKGEKIQPQKNAMDDFKGYQLSEGFDYKQNPEKYIPQPPRAGTKNGNNPKRGPDSHKADDLNGLNAHHAQPEESENQSELDVNMVMQRMRKQVDDEPSIDPDLPSNPSNINLAKKRESQKSDKLPALNGKDKKETQANANSKKPVDRREATRNILENNQKLEWEITDRKTAIQKKIDDMEKVKHRSENLPVINVRGASVDPKPQRQHGNLFFKPRN